MNSLNKYLYYCPECLGNGKKINYFIRQSDGEKIYLDRDIINNGFIEPGKSSECITCKSPLKETNLTIDEWRKIKTVSTDPDFVFAMEKLKENDIIEFNLKLSQMQSNTPKQEQKSSNTDNTPKCPTCGSPNIKKISGTKRWLGTGIFGLASSDIGKTMCCNSCGYKW